MAIEVQLDDLTYCGKEPGSIGEAIVRKVFNPIDLAALGLDLRQDVVVREKMYLASMKENITRKRTGCGERTNSGKLNIREKFLDVVNLQIWDEICAEDFGGTVAELARKKGYDINNLEGTQILDLIEELYSGVWKRDMQSIIQFGDTALDPAVSDQNKTLSVMDGFWKLVFAGVALGADDPDKITRAVVVPGGALPANYTRDVFLPGLYFGQAEIMKQVPDTEKVYVLSGALYDNYLQSLMSTPATPASFMIMQDGQPVLKYNGILVTPNRMIDQKVATLKARGYLIVKGGFQVGTDTYQDSQVMTGWYSRDTDLNNIQVRYKLGIQYLDGDVLVVGY